MRGSVIFIKVKLSEVIDALDFTETIEDIRLQNQLYISLNGSGAFRRFKDTCINFDIINDWYKFRNEKYKKLAINWCKENNIEFE